MRHLIALVLVLFTASFASASEPDDARLGERERVEPAVTEQVVEAPELVLAPVVVEERASDTDEIAQDMPQRGSFWWIVGAIVVAGVILAVLL